jgi:hypothetical protein
VKLNSLLLWAAEASVVSAATADQVWKLLALPKSWPLWHETLESVSFDGPFQKGAQGIVKVKDLKPITFTISHVEKNKRFSLVCKMWNTTITTTFEVQSLAAGELLITHRVIVGGFFAPFLRRYLGKRLQKELHPSLDKLSLLL